MRLAWVQRALPNREQRLAIFAVHTRTLSLADDVDLGELADRAEGLGGAEIAAICQQVALDAIRALSARRSHGQAVGFQVEHRQFLAALESIQAGRIGTQLARRP